MTIADLLTETISKGASDLHLISGYPPSIRVDTHLVPLNYDALTGTTVATLITPIMSEEQKKLLEANRELDFAHSHSTGRFRINLYFSQNQLCAALRLIPLKVQNIDELGLPSIFHDIALLRQGFVLVTGPTGHGKTTSLAAVIDEINKTRESHVLTLEDPVEYIFSKSKAFISQREFGSDFYSWADGLKAALREDPDVVLVGEMRDYETIAAALTIAETGHLVLATLHTNSAAQTIDRIVDVFPENQQPQIRLQLSNVLEVVVSQRLLPKIGSGRTVADEIMVATPAIRSTIREGKTHLIDNIIQTSADVGMKTLATSLAELVNKGIINLETAQEYSNHPDDVAKLVHSSRK